MSAAAFDLIRIASGKNRTSVRWAELAHRGVMRKGAPFGYITHVMAVGTVAAGAGGDRNVVAACHLHDTVEDTRHLPDRPVGAVDADGQLLPRRVYIEDIQAEFGYSCAAYVNAVTKGSEMKGVRLEDQAAIIVAKLSAVAEDPLVDDPMGGFGVKASDLLVNISDLVFDAENEGVNHFDEIFGERRAARKIRHYLELSQMIADVLANDPRWSRLAEALITRAAELRTLLDQYEQQKHAG